MKVGTGRTAVTLDVKKLDEGCVVSLTGGKSHIGGVALYSDGKLSFLKRKNHRDGELAQEVARIIAEKTKEPVLCFCGIHIDAATKEEIGKIVDNSVTAAKNYAGMMKR